MSGIPDFTDPGAVARWVIRESDYSDQPGRFKLLACTPGGSSLAFTGTYEADIDRETGEWVATYTDVGHTWTGRSHNSIGALLAMLADRCGLAADIQFKPEPAEETGEVGQG